MTPKLTLIAVSLALCSQLSALTISNLDDTYVGSINPGQPASTTQEVAYINYLVGMAPNSSANDILFPAPPANNTQDLIRSDNVFNPALPTANEIGSIKNETGSTSVNVTGFEYVLGKYDAANDGAYVWYVGNLTGVQTLPSVGLGGQALSHWSLYNASGSTVPDGGMTLVLLGIALTSLAVVRRKLT